MKYFVFLVSMLFFTAALSQQVIVPEGVDCPPNNLRACLNNLSAAYDGLFQEKVALAEVNAINQVLSNEINTCEANLADANALLEKTIAERTSLQTELNNLRARLNSSEADLAMVREQGIDVDLGTLQATIEQLRTENSHLSGQLQLAQQQITALSSQSYSYEVSTASLEELTRELSQLRLQLNTLLLENEALKAQLAQTHTVVQTQTVYPDDYHALRAQLAQLQSQVGQVQTVVQTQTVYPDDYHTLRSQLDAALRENQQLRQALASQAAPMKVAPVPARPAPAPEK